MRSESAEHVSENSAHVPICIRLYQLADEARAREAQAASAFGLRVREARVDVVSAADRYDVRRDRLSRLEGDLVGEADALLSAARAAYDEGEMSLLELLDAARAFRDARLAAVSLTSAAWIAYYDLLRATGRGPEEER